MTTPRPVPAVGMAKAVPAERKFYWPKSPVEQTYSLAIGVSAAVIFLARFLTDGPAPAVTFALPAIFGFLFRMPKMPAIAILMLGYFLFAPGVFPFGTGETLLIRFGHFDLMNIILVSASLVYLFSQYRLYGMIRRAMPDDRPDHRTLRIDPHLRTFDAIPSGEILRLVLGLLGCVVLAEFLWLGITELYVEPALTFPIRWAGPPMMERGPRMPGSLPAPVSRLILFLLFTGTFVGGARFLFWYLRLSRLTPAEGSAIVADLGWSENRREQQRQEVWRAKARDKVRSS
jgi:hypothetical protein